MSDLICPKCQGPMRTYERNSVTVDQCTECRGIFLDRGELDRLIDAEAAWGREQGANPRREEYRPQERPEDAYVRQPYPPKKRRKSFFEDLFD